MFEPNKYIWYFASKLSKLWLYSLRVDYNCKCFCYIQQKLGTNTVWLNCCNMKKIQHIDLFNHKWPFLCRKKAPGLKFLAIIGIVAHVIHGLKKEKMQQTTNFGAMQLFSVMKFDIHAYTCIINRYTHPHLFACLFTSAILICC